LGGLVQPVAGTHTSLVQALPSTHSAFELQRRQGARNGSSVVVGTTLNVAAMVGGLACDP
jgi:hypothetical protein